MITRARRLRFDPRFPLGPYELSPLVEKIARACGTTSEAFDLELADDTRIARLNQEHLGCKGPTNILSFPSENPEFLGDLVLSVHTLERETFLYGQDPVEHTARLIAHGLLHLLGMDHGTEMERLTEAAMESVMHEAEQKE